jgi:hypothetical protein
MPMMIPFIIIIYLAVNCAHKKLMLNFVDATLTFSQGFKILTSMQGCAGTENNNHTRQYQPVLLPSPFIPASM